MEQLLVEGLEMIVATVVQAAPLGIVIVVRVPVGAAERTAVAVQGTVRVAVGRGQQRTKVRRRAVGHFAQLRPVGGRSAAHVAGRAAVQAARLVPGRPAAAVAGRAERADAARRQVATARAEVERFHQLVLAFQRRVAIVAGPVRAAVSAVVAGRMVARVVVVAIVVADTVVGIVVVVVVVATVVVIVVVVILLLLLLLRLECNEWGAQFWSIRSK